MTMTPKALEMDRILGLFGTDEFYPARAAFLATYGHYPEDPEPQSQATPVAPKIKAKAIPCPPLSEITMIQLTGYDNWNSPEPPKPQKGKRNKTYRYGVNIEVYTVNPAEHTHNIWSHVAWKCSTGVFPKADFIKQPAYLADQGKIERDYADRLTTAAHQAADTIRFGLLSGKGGIAKNGTAYIDDQYIAIEVIGNEVTWGRLYLNGAELKLTGWSKFTSSDETKRKPLAPNIVGACRVDLTGSFNMKTWPTQ